MAEITKQDLRKAKVGVLRRGRLSKQRGSAMLFIMFMVLAIGFVISVAATFGRQTMDIEYRYERDLAVKRAWDAAVAQADAKSSASTLGILPQSWAFTLNGVSGTVNVADNSGLLANSLLVTSTLTAPDGTTYAESSIIGKITSNNLTGSYWWTNGTTVNTNPLAWTWMMKNPTPTGTFNASALNYAGTSASTILSWLSGDSSSYVGTTDNLTDGVVQLAGTITTPVANTVIKASSEYGSYISIDGDNYIINTGTGTSIKTGTVTIPTAGTYPIFATYYNHTGSTAADLNLQWSTTTGLLYTAIPGNDLAPLNQRWMFNGSAIAYGNGVELMSNAMNQTGSAWLAVLEPANAFHASFDFYAPTAAGDGFTFAVQTYGTNSIGTGGLGLGYGGLVNSWALTFQFTNPVDYWNLMSGGTILTSDGITLSSYNINLASGDLFHCTMTQSGTTFTGVLTDETTGATVTGDETGFTPSTYLGATSAYVGFTGATGSSAASTVYITNFNYGP